MTDNELDQLLKTYSQAEPPAGLEQRILKRVQQRRVWPWGIVPVAAAAVFVWMLWIPQPVVAPPLVQSAMAAPPLGVETQAPKVVKLRAKSPMSHGMTPEEKALQKFAASLAGSLSIGPAGPIEIQPIVIDPLETGVD